MMLLAIVYDITYIDGIFHHSVYKVGNISISVLKYILFAAIRICTVTFNVKSQRTFFYTLHLVF